jgi:hypothetical protein
MPCFHSCQLRVLLTLHNIGRSISSDFAKHRRSFGSAKAKHHRRVRGNQ